MKPVIAISADLEAGPVLRSRIKLLYVDAVRRAGGVPVVLPAIAADEVGVALARVDGVLMSGGDDIDLRAFGVEPHASTQCMHPRRQELELALARAVLERGIPTLGICLGMQVLAVASGASLHQHLPDAGIEGLVDHRGEHSVELLRGSRLQAIAGELEPRVVSQHHQAVVRVPHPLRQSARAPDGVVEGLEATDGRFLVGVQWHPERAPDHPVTERLFRALVDATTRR